MAVNLTKLPNSVYELEHAKFEIDEDGEARVRTSAKGTFTPSGLTVDLRVTTLDVSDVAIKLPATPLAGRNSLIIYNKSTTDTLYIGKSNVTADTVNGNDSGWEIEPGSYFSFDIKNNIEVYGICETGKTVKVKLLEVA